MKYIVLNKPFLYVENTMPASWKGNVEVIYPEEWEKMNKDSTKDEFYAINDGGYRAVSAHIGPDRGFCKKLDDLANNKYIARSTLKSLQDVPYVLCDDNVVKWPYGADDKLFAKPVHGFAATGSIKSVKNGDVLPDIGEPYLIEKYIDDKYQRILVDGYICGDEIGILTSGDNIYLDTKKVQYHYLGFPSKYHSHPKLKEKFFEVMKEIKEVTGFNNQIIDIEFFAIDGTFSVMEINPRITFNAVPLYPEIIGVNVWEFMENLLKGKVMEYPKEPKKTGIVRYTYTYSDEPKFIQHDENTFSIYLSDYSQTYSLSDISTPYWEMIKEIDAKYPMKMPVDD